jgi:exopolyphosphatase/guanosine-5'-triphosphate,3'-diphosphate pyrophosphatase
MVLQAQGNNLSVRFPPNWLEQHPLTQADLEQENHYLQEVDLSLSFE